ncbi:MULTISPECIES: HlyD family secretion protein [Alteromonadaceae]|uniref:HlyD family secretion protein n=1 Tax=Alteromonadaceae TaxID=72275 RepID=UPI001C09A08D|nr:HlyD family efflux transporter periplasmic adaptor subunit [Aliiglaciecola lipolytica]MBU2876338.1 HlyD family efflux transporter periplasmic adaptor subunit [Aliiglaciecola lipolytica]
MKQGNKLPFSAVLLVIVAVAFWLLWDYIQQPSLPSDFASGNGRIEAVQVDISTKIAGRVQEVIASEGDLVQPQQALARINTDQLQAQLLRAEADVAAGESLIASAKASIAQAKAQQLLAKQELSRASDLIKKSAISKETYDTRVSALAVADASVEAADAMLISRQRNVDALKAGVHEIQTQIEDATLVSPSIGRVLYRLAEPGEVLGSGGKVLTIINLADVYMEIFLPSSQVHRIAIGAEARVKLDILDYPIPATVSFVSPESQFTPKQVETQSERDKLMFRVKVRIPQELVLSHIEQVKTGVRGVAYVRLAPTDNESPSEWPEYLQNFPPALNLSEKSGN